MLLQRIVYYFFVVLIFFLLFDKLGYLSFKLTGVASLYAAAALFASVNTIIFFVLSSLVYRPRLRGSGRFVADLLSVLVAAVIPIMLLSLVSAFAPAYLALNAPFVPSLLKALSLLVPAVWIGWLALAFFFFEAGEPAKVKAAKKAERSVQEEVRSVKQPKALRRDEVQPLKQSWQMLFDVAILRIDQENFAAAKPLLAECLVLLERDKKSNPLDVFNVMHYYANCLLQLEEYAFACSLFERALRLLNRLPHTDSFDDGVVFSDLMDGLEACHQRRAKGSIIPHKSKEPDILGGNSDEL